MGICTETLAYAHRDWFIYRDIGISTETMVYTQRDRYVFTYRQIGIYKGKLVDRKMSNLIDGLLHGDISMYTEKLVYAQKDE